MNKLSASQSAVLTPPCLFARPAGVAGRRPGVAHQTERPPEEELHPQQRAALRTGAVCGRRRPPVRGLQLPVREHSGGMTRTNWDSVCTRPGTLSVYIFFFPFFFFFLIGATFQRNPSNSDGEPDRLTEGRRGPRRGLGRSGSHVFCVVAPPRAPSVMDMLLLGREVEPVQ